MSDRHFAHWPRMLPRHLTVPATHLYRNIEVSALRYPDKAALVFYDSVVSYARLQDETERLAAHLQQVCGVRKGDRVLLYMQNSPQFVIGFYAILRADAVVVPVNPMNLTEELRHYVSDAGARTIVAPQDLFAQVRPLLREGLAAAAADPAAPGLRHAVVAAYSDYATAPTDLPVPTFVHAPREPVTEPGAVPWTDALAAGLRPAPIQAGPDDLAVMRRMLAIKLLGAATTFQPFVAALRAQRRGALVGVASIAGWRGMPGNGAYCASKGGLIRYLESLRAELRSDSIVVSTVSPGYLRTALTAGNRFAMPGLLEPEDAARALLAAVARGRTHIVLPARIGWLARLLNLLPDALHDRLLLGQPRKPRVGEAGATAIPGLPLRADKNIDT